MKWPVPEDFGDDWKGWGRKLILALRDSDPAEKQISEPVLVTVVFTNANLPGTIVQHDLHAEVFGTRPNVLFTVVKMTHSGAGGGAVNIEFTPGGPVTADTISLVAVSATRTINAGNPLTAILRFERHIPT